MTQNPYAVPAAAVAELDGDPVAVYSPAQVACGGLLGGPVGLIYFLRQNFIALHNEDSAKNCLIYGAILIIGLVILLQFLPDKFPSSPFNIFYILAGRYIAQQYQMTKQAIADSPMHAFRSNWNVLGLGLACLAGSAILVVVPTVFITVAFA